MPKQQNPTTRDLALRAGVSIATVDRVLNNRSNVRENTKKKVQVAIKELGFRRNEAASALAKGRPHIFNVLVPDTTPEFARMIDQAIWEINSLIERHFARLESSRVSVEDLANYVDQIDPAGCDGLMLFVEATDAAIDALCAKEKEGVAYLSLVSAKSDFVNSVDKDLEAVACGRLAGQVACKVSFREPRSITLVTSDNPTNFDLRCAHEFETTVLNCFPNLRSVTKQNPQEKEFLEAAQSADCRTYFLCDRTDQVLSELCKKTVPETRGGFIICGGLSVSTLSALNRREIDALVCPNFHSKLIEGLDFFSFENLLDKARHNNLAPQYTILWNA